MLDCGFAQITPWKWRANSPVRSPERTHGRYAQAKAAIRSAFEKAGLAAHASHSGAWRTIGRLRQQNVRATRLAAACAAAVAIVTVLAGCKHEPVGREVEGFPFTIQPQEVESRIWKDVQPDVVAVLGNSAGLHRPGYLFGDQHGNLFVTDNGDFRVKKFDADGSLVQIYGKGRGKALGEFEAPMYASVDPEGNVWVPDLSLQRLAIFEDDGTLLRSIPLDYRPYGLRHLSDGRYFVYIVQGGTGPQSGMFGLYRDAELLTQFGATELDPTTAAGEIVAIDGELVFSPSRFEFIVRYDERGNVVYARETLQQEQKSVLEDKSAMQGYPLMLKTSLGHQGGRLYINPWVLSKKRGLLAIDVYRAADGSYEFSFELPEPRSRGMDVGRDFIYVVKDTAVVIYRLSL